MKAIRYFVAILLFCGLGLGLEAAERPGKEKKEKKRRKRRSPCRSTNSRDSMRIYPWGMPSVWAPMK